MESERRISVNDDDGVSGTHVFRPSEDDEAVTVAQSHRGLNHTEHLIIIILYYTYYCSPFGGTGSGSDDDESASETTNQTRGDL